MFLWGSLKANALGLTPDPELSYVAAMFHDLGLAERYRRTDQRFELDDADNAKTEVTTAHPRPDFKQRIQKAFYDGMKDRPDTTFSHHRRIPVERIAQQPRPTQHRRPCTRVRRTPLPSTFGEHHADPHPLP